MRKPRLLLAWNGDKLKSDKNYAFCMTDLKINVLFVCMIVSCELSAVTKKNEIRMRE